MKKGEKKKAAKPGTKRYQLENLTNIPTIQILKPTVFIELETVVLIFNNSISLKHYCHHVHTYYEGKFNPYSSHGA
jgi:hypothetical protein